MIKAKFDLNAIFDKLELTIDQIVEIYTVCMRSALIDTVTEAKSLDTYKNRSGNLRSSIGWVLYVHGKKVGEYFERVTGPEGAGTDPGNHGIAAGLKAATEAAEKYPDKIVGVVVAGEDYALAVESKGFDVITGPCNKLQRILRNYIKEAIKVILE